MSLDSYHSLYPLEYYEVGTCYSFYKEIKGDNRRDATNEEISKFSQSLNDCYKENSHIMVGGSSAYNGNICRAIGVVVDKGTLTPGKKNYLDVMFIGDNNVFFVAKYILGEKVFLNDKESTVPGRVASANADALISGPTKLKESGPTKAVEPGPTKTVEPGPTKA